MGKTYTALVLAEELLGAGAQVVIADPVGVCWGLRAAANGKDPGLPIIVMGGDHGDVPLEASAGKVIAEFIVDTRSSVVLDLSLLRKGDQVRFMTDFAETLYHRNRQLLHLVLDEADAFAPQRPMPDQARMLGVVQDLVRRGRARGIGVTLVTQRAAVLWKDVLTQVEVLVVKAIAAGSQPVELVQPNQVALNGMARLLKNALAVPGVRVVEERTTATRCRGRPLDDRRRAPHDPHRRAS
jgi:DNA helicase HerA-like ATPase